MAFAVDICIVPISLCIIFNLDRWYLTFLFINDEKLMDLMDDRPPEKGKRK